MPVVPCASADQACIVSLDFLRAEVERLRERYNQLAFDGREVLRQLSEAERQLRIAEAKERGPSEF